MSTSSLSPVERVAGKILAIFALLSLVFVAGCTTAGNSEAQLSVTTLSGGLPAGSVSVGGGAYPSTTLAASGGTAPYTWAVTSGNLPTGLSLSASGTISGSPTTAGTFNFTVTVTDSATPVHTAPANLSIVINGILTISTSGTLSTTGEAGAAYSSALAETGGVGPFTWVLKTGSLPGGLTLGSTGTISGTISGSAVPGNFTFTAQVTDSQGNVVASGTLTLKVDAALVITPPALSNGVANVSYTSAAFTASGGSGSGYTFAVASGSLSPLSIGSSTGIITGTPTTAGTLQFTIKVTDSLGYSVSTGNLSITINPALSIMSPTLPIGVVSVAYNSPAFTASGGSGSGYTFTVASGSLAPLSIGSSTGVITGTPTTTGTLQFTVKVTDSLGDTATTSQLSITVNQALAITPPTLATGIVNASYTSPAFTASGGSGTGYTYTVASGSLAPLVIGSSSGVITGTPTTATTLQFTVKVTDSQGDTATSSALSITIYPTLTITPPTLPIGVVNVSYTSPAFTASGGSGTGYSFAVASGSLAPLTIGSSTGIITGTPTTSGTLQFTIKVTDSVGNTVTSSQLSITVNGPLAITPPTLATGVINVSYTSPAFTASGGSGTGYTFTVASGSLAPLTIGSSTGVITGTPTATGTLQFAIKVTDSQGDTATTTTLSITVNPALAITPPTLLTGLVNVSYTSPAFTASGGSGTGYTYTVASGSLAPLAIGSSSGIITGTPTATGTLQFAVKVTDSQGNTATTTTLSITIYPTLMITVPTLPAGTVSSSYTSPAFTASGGSGSGYTFAVATGSLSPLSIGSSTGIITGTPTIAGALQFTIKVTDSVGNTVSSSQLSITVNGPLAITPPTLLPGLVNAGYTSPAFIAAGGSGTGYTFTVASGSLAPLVIGSSTGVITGTPTATGTLQFAIKVTDSLGDTATTNTLSITIYPTLTITPPTLPFGVVNVSYTSPAFTASGGSGTGYSFAVASGSLAPLTIGSSTGIITGTPTTSGTLQFTIKVTDSVGNTVTSSQLSITVNGPLAITPPTLATGVINVSYTSPAFTASGGSGTGYTFTVASGSLAPLTIGSSTGVITGTPTATGTLQFAIKVTDSQGDTATTTTLSITVNASLTINPPTLPTGAVGSSYTSPAFTASGGSGTGYTYTVTSGSLAPLTIGSSTGIITGTPAATGTLQFAIKVTDSQGNTATTTTLSITINPTLTITPPTLPVGVVSVGYTSPAFTASGGSGTGYTFTVASGSLSPLSIGSSSGIITGTPKAPGTLQFTIKVTDSVGNSATTSMLSITVNGPLAITPPTLATGVINASYTSPAFTASGGSGTGYTYTVASGSLSPLIIGSSTGIISGTPTATGTLQFAITVTDSQGNTATTTTLSITVNAGVPTVTITVPGPLATPPIQAGAGAVTISINVANDVSGEIPFVQSFSLNGVACTTATCGTLGSVAGTAGSGTYTLSYTPPSSLTGEIAPTLVVATSVYGFFGTTSFNVYPSGVVVVLTNFGGNIVVPGTAARTNYKATVYNDVGNAGVTVSPLMAYGYACANLSPNSCGTLAVGTTSTSGTTTTIPITYTPPSGQPSSPDDRPMIIATSVADPTKSAVQTFLITSAPAAAPLSISYPQKFDSALTGGGALGTPITVSAGFNDSSNSKSATWTLMANGAVVGNCNQVGPNSTCTSVSGNLSVPATTVTNGNSVTSTVTYTPPATVPTGSGQANPVLIATMTANSSASDSFSFNIVDGTCGTGNNGVLNGNYAFLLKGGGPGAGYTVTIGSINANGNGVITSGFEDRNGTTGPLTGLTLTGTYSVGSDNRGCLTLTNSNGGSSTYRFALGTLSSGVATQGSMIDFVDDTGNGMRLSGVIMQQNLTGLTSSTFSGTYVFGEDGVDGEGGRIAAAGLVTSNGSGTLSNISLDADDNGSPVTLSGGSGTYSLASGAPGGRGTFTTTINSGTSHTVFYIVSSSETLFLNTDLLTSQNSMLSGQGKKQTGSFTSTTLDSKNYAFYFSGLDNSNGGDDIVLGQAAFRTNGAATTTVDENDNGIEGAEGIDTTTQFAITSTGRTTLTSGGGSHPPIFYLIDSTQAFMVDTGSASSLGYMQEQTGGPYTNLTVPATAFFGGGGVSTGGSYDVGAVAFDTATTTIAGTDDGSSPSSNFGCTQNCGNGLNPNSPLSGQSNQTVIYSFVGGTAPGQGTFGSGGQAGILAYLISPTKVIFMQLGGTSSNNTSPPELFIGQQ